ncbi:MAG TPA: cell division protein FtsA [Candidatus Saccharimonadales bacterium]
MHGSSTTTPFVGLDVGTSTVRCVVGMVDPNTSGNLSIVGHGSARNLGMRRGVVVHVEDATEAIVHALTEAERVSGMRINGATVNINGSHISGMNSKGVIAISAANREITPEDRMRAEEAATIIQLPSNREIIQVFAKSYRLDGQENIKDPVGMHGVRLEVDTHIVTVATPNLRSLDMALEKAQVAPHNHTLSSLAAAEAVLGRQQREAGTVLLDIGAGTTNIVVLEDGEVQHVAVLPIGGIHITNDLAIGLKTDLDVAEAVKVKYAALGGQAPKRDIRIKVNAHDHIFKAEEVSMITEARVEELFEYVQKELVRIHRAHKLPGGVVIVGGTSKLPGIAEFAKEKMQLAARVGELRGVSGLIDTVADPAYAAATGLMVLDMLLVPDMARTSMRQTSARALKIVDNLFGRFKH